MNSESQNRSEFMNVRSDVVINLRTKIEKALKKFVDECDHSNFTLSELSVAQSMVMTDLRDQTPDQLGNTDLVDRD